MPNRWELFLHIDLDNFLDQANKKGDTNEVLIQNMYKKHHNDVLIFLLKIGSIQLSSSSYFRRL